MACILEVIGALVVGGLVKAGQTVVKKVKEAKQTACVGVLA